MCVVSMVGDHYSDRWRRRFVPPDPVPFQPFVFNQPQVTREEFEALRAEVNEMVALLRRAKKYDEEHGEPACEMEEKLALLRRVAEMVGVDLAEAAGL